MNQQMDLLGAWAAAHERELRHASRGRAVRRRRGRAAGLLARGQHRRTMASALARG